VVSGGDRGGDETLEPRVLQRLKARRQRQGKKGKEGERPLKCFTTVKAAHQARLARHGNTTVLERLKARRQRQGKKGEEGERPLKCFTTVKAAH
jgi:hypothetical protein